MRLGTRHRPTWTLMYPVFVVVIGPVGDGYVTCSATVYVPALLYTCVGFSSVLEPSPMPNVQTKVAAGSDVESFVNCTVCPGSGVVSSAWKLTADALMTVIVICAVLSPQRFDAFIVTTKTPGLENVWFKGSWRLLVVAGVVSGNVQSHW